MWNKSIDVPGCHTHLVDYNALFIFPPLTDQLLREPQAQKAPAMYRSAKISCSVYLWMEGGQTPPWTLSKKITAAAVTS